MAHQILKTELKNTGGSTKNILYYLINWKNWGKDTQQEVYKLQDSILQTKIATIQTKLDLLVSTKMINDNSGADLSLFLQIMRLKY